MKATKCRTTMRIPDWVVRLTEHCIKRRQERSAKIEEVKKTRIIPQKLKAEILQRDNNICVYCGRTLPIKLHIDHMISPLDDGSNHPDNLVTACINCNMLKSGKTIAHFKERIIAELERGYKPSYFRALKKRVCDHPCSKIKTIIALQVFSKFREAT